MHLAVWIGAKLSPQLQYIVTGPIGQGDCSNLGSRWMFQCSISRTWMTKAECSVALRAMRPCTCSGKDREHAWCVGSLTLGHRMLTMFRGGVLFTGILGNYNK